MTTQRPSFRLCCVFCALLSGILWLLMTGGIWTPAAQAEEKSTKPSDPKPAEPKSAMRRYQFNLDDHDPNGIGKFYMGREIAHVMGFQGGGVLWLERNEREEEERLTKLVKLLKLKSGMVVADIGAGSGVISIMMANEVGENGKVLAVDIQKEMLERLGDKLNNIGVKNIELVLSTEKSTKLEEASVDLALMVDVYHEFKFPYEMTMQLSNAIKPGGRVVFVEYRREDPEVPIKLIHKMSEAQVKKEISQPEFGLKWKETFGDLPRQHVIVFEKEAKGE